MYDANVVVSESRAFFVTNNLQTRVSAVFSRRPRMAQTFSEKVPPQWQSPETGLSHRPGRCADALCGTPCSRSHHGVFLGSTARRAPLGVEREREWHLAPSVLWSLLCANVLGLTSPLVHLVFVVVFLLGIGSLRGDTLSHGDRLQVQPAGLMHGVFRCALSKAGCSQSHPTSPKVRSGSAATIDPSGGHWRRITILHSRLPVCPLRHGLYPVSSSCAFLPSSLRKPSPRFPHTFLSFPVWSTAGFVVRSSSCRGVRVGGRHSASPDLRNMLNFDAFELVEELPAGKYAYDMVWVDEWRGNRIRSRLCVRQFRAEGLRDDLFAGGNTRHVLHQVFVCKSCELQGFRNPCHCHQCCIYARSNRCVQVSRVPKH